jgi:hypothetical protein
VRRNLLRDVLRNPLLIPVVIVAGAALGYGACLALGFSLHRRDLAAATAITMIASGLGILPSWFLRKSDPGTLANASLGGTLAHTLITLALGAAWWMSRSMLERTPFLTWLLVLYWVSLAALATVTISMVKAATPERARGVAAPARPAAASTSAPVAKAAPAVKAAPAKVVPPVRTTPPRPGAARQTPPPPPRRTT